MSRTEHSLRVEAVVLRHMDWGEADRLLTLFSREAGKLRAVAKGVRKVRSRKAGHLEPFTRVKLMLARGRDLWIVTQAEAIDAYQPLHDNLEKIGHASYVIEVLDRFTYEEGASLPLYLLLVDALERIAVLDDPYLAIRFYEIQILDLLGYRPEMAKCVVCGKTIQPQDQFFSAQLGGAVCPLCGLYEPSAQPVSLETLKTLRHLQRSSYAQASRARIPPAVRGELEALLQHNLTYLLERALNTPAFIRAVKGKKPPG